MGKIFITISLLLTTLCAMSQVTYTFRYYSKVVSTVTVYYAVAMPSDSLTNPNKRPFFCWEPGSLETGTGNCTFENAVKVGYLLDLYLGLWDGGIVQSNGYQDSVVYPIYTSMQYESTPSTSVSNNRVRWNGLFSDYTAYRDTNQTHMGGLSQGGLNTFSRATRWNASSANDINFCMSFASFFGASPGGKLPSNARDSLYHYAQAGGVYGIATGEDDNNSIVYFPNEIVPYMNGFRDGSGAGYLAKVGVDGFTNAAHSAQFWDTLFKYNHTLAAFNNKSIYEWQGQFTKTPKAIAQTTINTSSSSVTLNGVSNGWYKTVAWTKQSGGSATITSASSDTTTVTGLSEGTYVFRMTVTNTADSRTATHDVTVNVSGVPPDPGQPAYIIKKRGRKVIITTD